MSQTEWLNQMWISFPELGLALDPILSKLKRHSWNSHGWVFQKSVWVTTRKTKISKKIFGWVSQDLPIRVNDESFLTCKCGAQAGQALKCPHGRKSTVAKFERHTLHSRWRSKSTYILENILLPLDGDREWVTYLLRSSSGVSTVASGSGSGVRGLFGLLGGSRYGLIRFWETWIGDRRGFDPYRNRILPVWPRGTKLFFNNCTVQVSF